MTKKLTILIAPMSGVGHVNATLGIAECLRDRGHRVVYLVDHSFAGTLKKQGFEEEIFRENKKVESAKPGAEHAEIIRKSGMLSGISSLDKMKIVVNTNLFDKLLKEKMESSHCC